MNLPNVESSPPKVVKFFILSMYSDQDLWYTLTSHRDLKATKGLSPCKSRTSIFISFTFLHKYSSTVSLKSAQSMAWR